MPIQYVSLIQSKIQTFIFQHKTASKTESERLNDYSIWINTLNQTDLYPEVFLPNQDENQKINTLLSKLFNVDFSKRYINIEELLGDLKKII